MSLSLPGEKVSYVQKTKIWPLLLAGGNAVSPAIYDTASGKCLNDPELVQRVTQHNVLTYNGDWL